MCSRGALGQALLERGDALGEPAKLFVFEVGHRNPVAHARPSASGGFVPAIGAKGLPSGP
jgi:hypothetical protein